MPAFPLRLAAAALACGFLAGPAFAADHAVTISNFKFEPARLTVAAGDTVTFTNKDGSPHTATADDGGFNTGTLKKGQSKQVTIGTAGNHPYHCAIHTAMKGAVTAK